VSGGFEIPGLIPEGGKEKGGDSAPEGEEGFRDHWDHKKEVRAHERPQS